MLGEVISTAGPNHMNYCDSYNLMPKFNYSSPLSNVFEGFLQAYAFFYPLRGYLMQKGMWYCCANSLAFYVSCYF